MHLKHHLEEGPWASRVHLATQPTCGQSYWKGPESGGWPRWQLSPSSWGRCIRRQPDFDSKQLLIKITMLKGSISQGRVTTAALGIPLFIWGGESFLFIFLILINFYWSIVALQNCVSFCCIAKRISYMYTYESVSHSVTSDSLQTYGLLPIRPLCPWNSPGQNTGVDSRSLLQGIFSTQGSNPGLPHCRQILYQLSHQGSPCTHISPLFWIFFSFRSPQSTE